MVRKDFEEERENLIDELWNIDTALNEENEPLANREHERMKEKERISKDEYYLAIAEQVAKRGTCLRRNYGAVIVKNDEIISTGYTGVPRGYSHCTTCEREKLNVAPGKRYDLCKSVHAEMNAIISAARKDMIGATLYLAGVDAKTGELLPKSQPCELCKRMIINSGIDTVISNDNGKIYKRSVAWFPVYEQFEKEGMHI